MSARRHLLWAALFLAAVVDFLLVPNLLLGAWVPVALRDHRFLRLGVAFVAATLPIVILPRGRRRWFGWLYVPVILDAADLLGERVGLHATWTRVVLGIVLSLPLVLDARRHPPTRSATQEQ